MKELKPCLPLQIFALDAEIFKFKKGLIYANEMNGDVIHVYQVNLQQKPLKLSVTMTTSSFPGPTNLRSIC